MATTLLFLGAGASRSFGPPTMIELVSTFEEHLKKENIKGRFLYSRIKEILQKGYDNSQIDIESIFSVIQGIAENTSPQKMGAFPFYYYTRFSSPQSFPQAEIDEAKNLREHLEKFIQNACVIRLSSGEIDEVFRNSYDVFFRSLPGTTRHKNQKGYDCCVGWRAFTTNYDKIFENYWLQLRPVVDFFNRNETEVPYFDATKQISTYDNTFVKLHGSLDWEILEDGEVLEISPDAYVRSKKKGKAMLYPIQQKDLYLHPWATLFQELRKGLKECDQWYVIGYGFNDPFILNAFLESFTSEKQLILINPAAIKLLEKFPKNLQQYIIPLPVKFGGKYFPLDYIDFINNCRTVEVELSSKSIVFGMDFPSGVQFIRPDSEVDRASITYHDHNTSVEYAHEDLINGKAIFEIKIPYFKTYEENIELITLSSDGSPVYATLKNQGRLLYSFTTSVYQPNGFDGRYFSKVIIDLKKFFPS